MFEERYRQNVKKFLDLESPRWRRPKMANVTVEPVHLELVRAKIEDAERTMRDELNRQLYADGQAMRTTPIRVSWRDRLRRWREDLAYWIAPWLQGDDW